jgi:hypothetical protein
MSDEAKDGSDRRDFMISSLAMVGASAALMATAGVAGAEAAAAATGKGTVYTGDIIQGKKVVSMLDVTDLEPGKKHFLYF